MHKGRAVRTLVGALTKSEPFELISLDFVGPRRWRGTNFSYLVIIDHASRFVMAEVVSAPTASAAKRVLQMSWVKIFQAPLAVLTDRGKPFLAEEFDRYITRDLRAYHVFTTPYYPQGNGINEACHKALEYALAAGHEDPNLDFSTALADAVAVHNATPHVSTRESPYAMLFGFEPTMPGWQTFAIKGTAEGRKGLRLQRRQAAMIRARLENEKRALTPPTTIVPGDWVVIHLPLALRRGAQLLTEQDSSIRYNPTWSLPAKVHSVEATTVTCDPCGVTAARRRIARTRVKLLKGDIPATLYLSNLQLIQRHDPRTDPTAEEALRQIEDSQPLPWKAFMDQNHDEEPEEEAPQVVVPLTDTEGEATDEGRKRRRTRHEPERRVGP